MVNLAIWLISFFVVMYLGFIFLAIAFAIIMSTLGWFAELFMNIVNRKK